MKYEKMYSKNGIPFFFKINKCNFKNSKVMVKFMKPNDEGWNYHLPDKVFRNVFHLIKFLQKNTETKNIKYSVIVEQKKDF